MATTTKRARDIENLTDYVCYQTERAKAAYDEAKSALLTDFEVNATSAIEWKAKAVVAAQMQFVLWDAIRKAAARDAATDALVVEFATDRCRREIEGFFGSNSTCPWHNAARRAEAEVADHFLRYEIRDMNRLAGRPADNA